MASTPKTPTAPNTPAASKQVNGKSHTDNVRDLDKAIAAVLHEIKGLDKGIKKLNERRTLLTAKYEQLNEQKQLYTSEVIATEQDWESGKCEERQSR